MFLLYLDGVRLDPDIARASRLDGWLVFRRKRSGNGMPFEHALLLRDKADEDYTAVRRLDHCVLTLINGGIRLVGKDWNVDHKHTKQAWWIVPATTAAHVHPTNTLEGS
ncbi:hypothetical protein RCH27_08390 [Paracidovorax citrulli]|uniref:hypothetical protein n=1 Tax=Paracidovorax citrulli TaxID=80869 RepID=UPI003A800515